MSVVVTGIGLATPLAFGKDKTWNSLLNGLSAVKKDKEFPDILTARIENLPLPDQVRLTSIAFLACNEAFHDSGLKITEEKNIGCTVSVSKQNLFSGAKEKIVFNEGFYQSNVGRQMKRLFNLGGPLQNVVAACATGVVSIALGASWIEQGLCDVVLCGAVEASFHPLYVAGFSQMGVLAKGKAAPFSKDREGFAMGEGAGILVLENKKKAMLRSAKIYAEVLGWDLSNSISDVIAFDKEGKDVAGSIRSAMLRSGITKLDYINAHGTGTKINDVMETNAIKSVFGGSAKDISISSTKAATGHMLGAAGAVEAAFTAMAVKDNVVPPTLNLTNPDPECGLDYTAGVRKEKLINTAMSLSFGFGGQIGAVIFGK